MFENSTLAAHQPPTEEELALLEPFRGKVPQAVFTTPFRAPVSDGSGHLRSNLRKASRLLKTAGYNVKDGVLTNRVGKPLAPAEPFIVDGVL